MLSVLRRIGAHPRVEPYVAHALRSRAVRPSLPFFLGEVRGRGEREYTVRANGARILIEHGTSDAATFDQAFISRVYEPSSEAAAALEALGRPPVILDLGANIGLFSVWAQNRWPGARIKAVEPLERNVRQLRRQLELTLQPGTWEVVAAAATTADGEVTFVLDDGDTFAEGRIAEDAGHGGNALTVPARDVFKLAEGVDLLKIDIEGAEWPILADERFSADVAPVVMLEHHPAGAPGGTTPEEAAERALREAGYEVQRTVTEGPGAGIVWGVRADG
jgi:FkbM family methyltransferase